MLLAHHISILQWFLEDHVTLKTALPAFPTQMSFYNILKEREKKNIILNCNIHNITILLFFCQLNVASVSIRIFFQSHKKNLTDIYRKKYISIFEQQCIF